MELQEFNIEMYNSLLNNDYKYVEILDPTGKEIGISGSYFKVVICLKPHRERIETGNVILDIEHENVVQMANESEKVFYYIEL